MVFPQPPSPPHQYSEAIQLKLYQAFIFSIPILFAIILILLFYLFYLKRRATSVSSNPPVLPRTINDANLTVPSGSDLKDELKNKLCTVLFDEYMKTRDSQCCVCLGEYEEKQEVVQVPSCKHVFHMDCIRHWLWNNSTCPLCRAPVVLVDKSRPKSHQHRPPLASPANFMAEEDSDSNDHQGGMMLLQVEHSTRSEGSSSSSSSSNGSGSRC